MKIELLDVYYIRARLSASIILLSPIAITAFLCFEEINAFISSSVFVFALLAFSNYVPLLQRQFSQSRYCYSDCATQLLLPSNPEINTTTKNRYYRKLSMADDGFRLFEYPSESEDFKRCCDSAISFLKEKTRDDHHVQEENINYGFCKNLMASKTFGIIISSFLIIAVGVYSYARYDNIVSIPMNNYLALFVNIAMLLFWIFGITQKMLEKSAMYYAKTLISKIDSLDMKTNP